MAKQTRRSKENTTFGKKLEITQSHWAILQALEDLVLRTWVWHMAKPPVSIREDQVVEINAPIILKPQERDGEYRKFRVSCQTFYAHMYSSITYLEISLHRDCGLWKVVKARGSIRDPKEGAILWCDFERNPQTGELVRLTKDQEPWRFPMT